MRLRGGRETMVGGESGSDDGGGWREGGWAMVVGGERSEYNGKDAEKKEMGLMSLTSCFLLG